MWKRLSIAFVVFAIVAVACYYVSPKIHVTIPWYLPMLAFVITMISAVWTAPRQASDEDDREPVDTSDNPLREDMDEPPDPYRFPR